MNMIMITIMSYVIIYVMLKGKERKKKESFMLSEMFLLTTSSIHIFVIGFLFIHLRKRAIEKCEER